MPRPPGDAAESLVSDLLVGRGWTILDRRLRVGRLEVDVVARLGDVVALVEVRGRRVDGWVSGFDSIDPRKRKRLIVAARALWSRRFCADESVRIVRIDVASVTWRDGAPLVEIAEGAIEIA